MKFLWVLLGLVVMTWASDDLSFHSRQRRGASQTPASAGGYNIGNKGSTLSVSSALGTYNSFVGNVGVQGAYGPGSAGSLGLGAALGTYGGYLNEVGGYGYPGTYDTGYGYGGAFYAKN